MLITRRSRPDCTRRVRAATRATRMPAAPGRVQGFLSRATRCTVPLADVVEAKLQAGGDGTSDKAVVGGRLARGVPMGPATGRDAGAIPPACAHLPQCEEHATGHDPTRALARTLATPAQA